MAAQAGLPPSREMLSGQSGGKTQYNRLGQEIIEPGAYFRTEVGGYVTKGINAICSTIPLRQLITVPPTGRGSSWPAKIAVGY